MIDFFTSENDPSWGDQFKIACILGPSINEDDMIMAEPSCGEALW